MLPLGGDLSAGLHGADCLALCGIWKKPYLERWAGAQGLVEDQELRIPWLTAKQLLVKILTTSILIALCLNLRELRIPDFRGGVG
jgi:hypothetical protein